MTDDDHTTAPDEPNTPTVECSRCDEAWDLTYELEQRHAGNQALEQFAMDHHRHTGHFPDGVTPWLAECRHCLEGEQYLSERPARRFAETHARHTGHTVALDSPEEDGQTHVEPEAVTQSPE